MVDKDSKLFKETQNTHIAYVFTRARVKRQYKERIFRKQGLTNNRTNLCPYIKRIVAKITKQ